MEIDELKVSINQTGSYLVANNSSKYKIYHLKPFENFLDIQNLLSLIKSNLLDVEDFNLNYIEMYYSTNILILIGTKEKNKKINNKFIIYDESEKKIINEEEIEEGKNILNIKINKTK